jgi:hypothetical protein
MNAPEGCQRGTHGVRTHANNTQTHTLGKPWNNESAEKWWACGRHVRQKELAPSAKVRRHPGVLDVRGRSD